MWSLAAPQKIPAARDKFSEWDSWKIWRRIMGKMIKCIKVKFRLYAIANKLAKLEAINRKMRHLKAA